MNGSLLKDVGGLLKTSKPVVGKRKLLGGTKEAADVFHLQCFKIFIKAF
jgi:hypothetical protein